MSLEDFNDVVAVDLIGVFLCGRGTAAHMIRQAYRGVIVNISSISRAGNIGQFNYTTKADVSAMTAAWLQELARYGIRVAGIAPGFSETRMVVRMKPKLREQFEQRIPLHRFGKLHEIAHSALYILENDYFNGRTLEVDGGLRL
jgi:3-oxoacyl-[acyl-carrier protein] reductase